MKKFLLSLATVFCAGAFASAGEVTFTFCDSDNALNNYDLTPAYSGSNTGYITNGSTTSQTPITLTVDGNVKECWRNWSDGLRAYGKSTSKIPTLKVSGENVTITGVSFSLKSALTITADNGDMASNSSSSSNSWSGTGTDVTFTFSGGNNSIQVLTVTYATAGEVTVAAPVFSIGGGKFSEAQTVELTADDGCTIYYTTDGVDPTDDVNDGSTIKYTEEPITVDKSMTIKAIAYDADGNKSGIVSETYTIVELLEGAEGDGTIDNPYNAPAAINEANLDNTNTVYVKGIISNIASTSINATYGDVNFYISVDGTETNQFYIYQCKYLGGEKFTSLDQINIGDNVVVKGSLLLYYQTPELKSCQIVELNGEGPEPIVLEGEGTEANPFTVADVIAINPQDTSSNEDYPDKYWISGYIVGRCDGTTFTPVFSAEAGESSTVSASNIVLAPSADCTDAALCIPVQLISDSTVRAALNLADNPTVLGQKVAVYGNIYKYFSNPGVKNTSDYKLGSDGIEGIEIEENNAPVEYFNLQGVRVANPENGLYIMRQGDKVTKVIK